MNRDLVFFVAGLSFGVVAGYFVFRAVIPAGSVQESQTASSSSPGSSQIGLEGEDDDGTSQPIPLDEAEVSRLEAEAKQSPGDAEVRERLGRMFLDAERYDDAVAWLGSAVELAPEDLDARTRLALALLNLGRLDDAVATYEETLRIEPDHPPSLLGLGRVKLYLQQDIEGGLAMWERLIAVAPSSKEAASVRDELEALQAAHPGS